jgi:hypothetical protein
VGQQEAGDGAIGQQLPHGGGEPAQARLHGRGQTCRSGGGQA